MFVEKTVNTVKEEYVINNTLRNIVAVYVGVQDSGGVAAGCYLRNLSTEHEATEITMEIFNFKRPL